MENLLDLVKAKNTIVLNLHKSVLEWKEHDSSKPKIKPINFMRLNTQKALNVNTNKIFPRKASLQSMNNKTRYIDPRGNSNQIDQYYSPKTSNNRYSDKMRSITHGVKNKPPTPMSRIICKDKLIQLMIMGMLLR